MMISPEVIYQCNLQYLARLCDFIAERYNKESVWCEDEHWLFIIRDYLQEKGLTYGTSLPEEIRKHYQLDFELEKKLPIGCPPKDHKFDIVDKGNTIAIECKRYTWTVTGNVPSAKMGFTNEAA